MSEIATLGDVAAVAGFLCLMLFSVAGGLWSLQNRVDALEIKIRNIDAKGHMK